MTEEERAAEVVTTEADRVAANLAEEAERVAGRLRTYRRMTIVYAAIVAGIVCLVVVRFVDVASFNTVSRYTAQSCAERTVNVGKADQNVEATKRIAHNVRVYLTSAAKGRRDAGKLQLTTDPEQAVINLNLAALWGDQLAPAVKRAKGLLSGLDEPDCTSVPPERHYLPFDWAG